MKMHNHQCEGQFQNFLSCIQDVARHGADGDVWEYAADLLVRRLEADNVVFLHRYQQLVSVSRFQCAASLDISESMITEIKEYAQTAMNHGRPLVCLVEEVVLAFLVPFRQVSKLDEVVVILRKDGKAPSQQLFDWYTAFVNFVNSFSALQKKVAAFEHTEEILRQSRRYLRSMNRKFLNHIENMPMGYLELDKQHVILDWNGAAETIFGFTRTEALGRDVIELIVPEDAKEHVSQLCKELRQDSGGNYSVNKNVTRDGKMIICQWHNTPLYDMEGTVYGWASLVQDITEQRQAEERLEQANAAKSRFLAKMSHDLKSPLNVILGFSEILLPCTTESKHRSYLESIHHAGMQLLSMVNSVLEVAKNADVAEAAPVACTHAKFASGKLLIVDDIALNCILFKEMLQDSGLEIQTAESGREALTMAAEQQPAVIFLDIMMPVMDGWETARQLKENSCTQHIPIIAVTAAVIDEKETTGFQAFFADVLTKPVTVQKLYEKLAEYFSAESSTTALLNQGADWAGEGVHWKVAPATKERIVRELLPSVKKFNGAIEVLELTTLAESIVRCGAEWQCEALCTLGANLTECANRFDINGMRKCLRSLMQLADEAAYPEA